MAIKRLFVEKKKGFDIEAGAMCRDLKENLGLSGLSAVRIINRYDVEGMSDAEFELTKDTVFAEPQVDTLTFETLEIKEGKYFATEYLPGQFDQRADSAAQCVQIMTGGEKPVVRTAKVIVLIGDITEEQLEAAAEYCINPVEARRASLDKPETLNDKAADPEDVKVIDGFFDLDREGLSDMVSSMGLAMDVDDISFCQDYFKNTEKRNPTVTEIRMIDTYWSDHCRHTTFSTILDEVTIEDEVIANAYNEYKASAFISKIEDGFYNCRAIASDFDNQDIFKMVLYGDGTIKMPNGTILKPRQEYDPTQVYETDSNARQNYMDMYYKQLQRTQGDPAFKKALRERQLKDNF